MLHGGRRKLEIYVNLLKISFDKNRDYDIIKHIAKRIIEIIEEIEKNQENQRLT